MSTSTNKKEETWKWVGIGSVYGIEGTYCMVDYDDKDFVVWPEFKNVSTLKELEKIILVGSIKYKDSPTDCSFHFESNVFYRDSQGCALWELDDKGRVFLYGEKSNKVFVAKNIGCFVSRIFDENAKWYEQNPDCC